MEFQIGAVKLRKATKEDIRGFMEISQDKANMRYYGLDGIDLDTIEKAMEQIGWCNTLFDDNGGRWVITLEDDSYIGDIGFHNFQKNHNKVEMGYRLMKEYHGKGIMSQCVATLIRYGFEELQYNRIEAVVDVRNPKSANVLVKNGFVKEGTLRDYEFEHGEYVSLELYSILRREYKGA